MFVSDETICKFMSANFNKTVATLSRLDGYNDLNYKLEIVDQKSDSNSGYEILILKTLSSESEETINLQHRMMNFLYENGICTCRPVQTVEGSSVAKIAVFSSREEKQIEMPACVLTYVPGVTFRGADHPISLMKDVGRLAGKVDKHLQVFEQGRLRQIDTLWELSRAPEIKAYLEKYCSKEAKDLGLDIIDEYNEAIVPVLHSFQKGYVHGDLNDCNIIVSRTSADDETYAISGLIDYGDACVSFYVYEISTLMADLMSACLRKHEPLKVGRLVLEGYRQYFQLNSTELKSLRVVICVRMVQYYALGAEASEKDPDNEYASLDIDKYLEVCKHLWKISESEFQHDVI